VLFSEPKIPQSATLSEALARCVCFSALQRAENSSIPDATFPRRSRRTFQCSSASRKFLNRCVRNPLPVFVIRFQCSSASRKFLNLRAAAEQFAEYLFQCSSASRKFLNRNGSAGGERRGVGFSALQRAENSSIYEVVTYEDAEEMFQCSSASRKFLNQNIVDALKRFVGFSALQRAENSSIPLSFLRGRCGSSRFQCSSASRKFLNTIL